jgi:hypothetical protein
MRWESLSVLGIFALLTVPWFLAGQTRMGYLFVGVTVLMGIFEGVSMLQRKQTLSQQFWAWSKTHKAGAILVLFTVTLGWVGLVWHLAVKLFE